MIEPRNFEIEKLRNENSSLKTVVLPTYKPTGKLSLQKQDESEDSESAKPIANARNKQGLSGLSFEDVMETWNDRDLTDVQRRVFEEGLLGQIIVWEGYVRSVGTAGFSDETAYIIFASESEGRGTAFCSFEDKVPSDLAVYNKGDKLRFSGTFRELSLGPMLENCSVLAVLSDT
jgi:hypothetical protein